MALSIVKPCGCEIVMENGKEKQCALHKAAPDLLEALETARDAIASCPVDAFGEGSSVETLPTGESGEMKWPIRDELVDNFNRLIAKARGRS